jgi:DNA mismatch repair ATPase MutL
MKIYIHNFSLDNLQNLYKKLTPYHQCSESYLQLYSPDGIYIVDDHSINKLLPVDHDIFMIKNYHDNYSLLVDPSFFILEKSNYVSNDHITKKVQKHIFVKEGTNVKLVIESHEEVFKDIYIECPNGTNIKDALVKKEIIVLLVLLN